MNVFAIIGRAVLAMLAEIGRLSEFTWSSVTHIIRPPFFWRLLVQQMLRIGYFSLPVVALTAFFTGGALALQIYYGGSQINSESVVATIVALGITRELGPVLGGLMVAGRVSAAIAAELGTMRVTEQIDALYVMAVNPIQYLVVPRVIASVLMLPVLTIISDYVGIVGGYVVGVHLLGINSGIFVAKIIEYVEFSDLSMGMIKAAFFGLILSLIGCYKGFYTTGGAEGVGRATTESVVVASVLILASDYFLTAIMF